MRFGGRLGMALVLSVVMCLMAFVPVAEAHRSGCHRWHSCPSDTGSYVCGDLGYTTYCGTGSSSSTTPSRSTGSSSASTSATASTGSAAGEPAPDISVWVNGSPLRLETSPRVKDGRTLVPLRPIFEALGATIDWNGTTSTVTAWLGARTVQLQIGNPVALIAGSPYTMDVPAVIHEGRTLVPVRFVAEALGATVGWDSTTRRVTVNLSGG